jgi:hypothetical protein
LNITFSILTCPIVAAYFCVEPVYHSIDETTFGGGQLKARIGELASSHSGLQVLQICFKSYKIQQVVQRDEGLPHPSAFVSYDNILGGYPCLSTVIFSNNIPTDIFKLCKN